MKAIITIFLLTISATAFAQLPASGKLKVYKLQSNYLQGTPGSTSLNSSEGIGVFDANGLLTRKVSTAALGLPSGTLNRMAKFTGGSSLGNSTATDSAGYFGFGQVDGSGLGSARFNLKTQGNTSGTMGFIIKNSSNASIGYINNDGSFSWGATSSLTWSDGSAKLTASNAFQIGTIPNNPLYFLTNNTIRTALSSTGFVVNVPLDNTQATSFTGFASGTTAQRPSGAAGYHRANSDSANILEGYNTTAAAYELYATRNWVRANFGSGGITSINSQTGPAITIQGGSGVVVNNTTNTVTVSADPTSDIFMRVIDAQYADANNTGTSQTDLYTKTIAGVTLSANGASLEFDAAGTVNDATATVDLQLLFAGNGIGGTGAVSISGIGTFTAKGRIIRTSSSTARVWTAISIPNSSTKYFETTAVLTGLDFTTSNILKITGQAGGGGGGSSDITGQMWHVNYNPAP